MPPDFYYGKIKMTLTAAQKLFVKPLTAALAALLLACAAPAWADDHAQFQQGYTAYQAGNYAQALRLWQPLAQKGNAEAQYNLGVMYFNGQGVARNYRQAAAWYKKVLAQPDTPENAEAKALARENLQGLSKRGVR